LPSIAREDLYLWGWYLTNDFSDKIRRPSSKFYNNNGLLPTMLYARWEEEVYPDASSYAAAVPLVLGESETVTFTNSSQQTRYYKYTAETSGTHYFSLSSPGTRVYLYIDNSEKTNLVSTYGYGVSYSYNLVAG
jgi:hypothetical protein